MKTGIVQRTRNPTLAAYFGECLDTVAIRPRTLDS